MYHGNQAVIQKELIHTIQGDRLQEVAHRRLVREALVGHDERTTNPISGLLNWVQKLANREPCITTEPAG